MLEFSEPLLHSSTLATDVMLVNTVCAQHTVNMFTSMAVHEEGTLRIATIVEL